MYGIKRNIKMNPQVVKHISKDDMSSIVITGKKARNFKSNGLSKYKYPVYDEVPAGDYFSKITSAKFTQTQKGKDAVEVLYEIKDGITCYKIANGKLPLDAENKPYYIKQLYPEDTQYYDSFVDSMSEALNVDDFDIEDIIGTTEYVHLSYDKSNIGGYSDRMPFEWEDFIVQTIEDDDDYIADNID